MGKACLQDADACLLPHHLGVTTNVCHAGLSRWQRIALVRELANANVQDGDSTVSARYARERKHSALELLEKARHKARDIFDRQVGSLLYTWTLVCDQEAYCCKVFSLGPEHSVDIVSAAMWQAAALMEKEGVEEESGFSDTETTVTGGQSQAVSHSGPLERPANASKAASKKDKKKPSATPVSEADEARELAEMRKGGFIEGKRGAPMHAPAGLNSQQKDVHALEKQKLKLCSSPPVTKYPCTCRPHREAGSSARRQASAAYHLVHPPFRREDQPGGHLHRPGEGKLQCESLMLSFHVVLRL